MQIQQLIQTITQKHTAQGIQLYPAADKDAIANFECVAGFELPADFKEFYTICNGFYCEEDMFRIIPLEEILVNKDYGRGWFHFAEYMIYSDTWTVKMESKPGYRIVNIADSEVVLTTLLTDFLIHFIEGNVFEEGELYEWAESIRHNN